MNPLINLAERVEAATGPDRELDHEIYVSADAENGSFDTRYTGSIDAAMQLVPEGWRLAGLSEPEHTEQLSGAALVRRPAPFAWARADGATLPLAICAAALRAKAGEG